MNKLITIGEALIDFIPKQKGRQLKDVVEFTRVAGGAPANVAACVSLLGKESYVLTKLGNDAFGDFIIDELQNTGVITSHIRRTSEANTALAFVSLTEDGERDFSFYRNPSADMLMEPNEVNQSIFSKGDVLHFCSVDLVEAPMKYAHNKAIEYAIENEMIISFDPNLRFPLWDDHIEYRKTILEYIPYSHILKVSDDELEFITGVTNKEKAIQSLFVGNIRLIILTCGSNGAWMYAKDSVSIYFKSYKSDVKDTTGAGDSFIGGILYQILDKSIKQDNIEQLVKTDVLKFAHAVAALVVSNYGAIPSLPRLKDVFEFIDNYK